MTVPLGEIGFLQRENAELRRALEARSSSSTDPRQRVLENEFVDRLYARWRVGEQEYGNQSMGMPPRRLAGEMCEEILDVAGWALCIYKRLRDLEATYEQLELLFGLRDHARRILDEGLSDEHRRSLGVLLEHLNDGGTET